MPINPPTSVISRASLRNWARMWLRRAPNARRRPISRTRSSTETSMMFMTPTPPIPSVRHPMNSISTCMPMVRPSRIGRNSSRPYIVMARLSVGEKRCRLATAARTWAMAFYSNRRFTVVNSSTLANCVFHRSPAVVKGMNMDSSSLQK